MPAQGRDCSVANALSVIGERWSLLALREVMLGVRRFDQIARNTGASRDILTTRLRHLEAAGVLARRQYETRPPRYEYVLTDKGTDLCDLLLVMRRFGDRWLAGAAGPPVLYRHHTCGEIGTVELRCSHCGTPMRADNIDVLPGPGMAVAAAG